MAHTQEGTSTVIVTREKLYDMENAQREILEDGIVNPDSNKLATGLSVFASVLGFFVTKAPTPVGVALSAVSLGLGMTISEKDILNNLSNKGRNFLLEMAYFMKINSEYDLIEIEYPYLKYFDVDDNGEDIKFVTGKGLLKRVHSSSGWIVM